MNQEIEIKAVLKNPDLVVDYLHSHAEHKDNKEQKDVYLVPAHSNFFTEPPAGRYLRVRFQPTGSVFEYIQDTYDESGAKLWAEEYETKVDNPEMLLTICEKLDMKTWVTVHKHRQTFIYKGHEIVVDHIEDLGWFVEVESPVTAASEEEAKAAKDECFVLLKEIKADWQPTPNLGYPDMILQKETF